MILLLALTKRAVAVLTLRQEDFSLCHGWCPVAGSNTMWFMVVPTFLGEYSQGHSLPFIFLYKREKGNLLIGLPKGKWVNQILLQCFKGCVDEFL